MTRSFYSKVERIKETVVVVVVVVIASAILQLATKRGMIVQFDFKEYAAGSPNQRGPLPWTESISQQ